MQFLIAGIALAIGVFLVGRWFVSTEPAKIVKIAKWVLVGIGVALVLALIVTRQFQWLLYTLPVFLPFIMRFRAARRRADNWSKMSGGGRTSGQRSTIETNFFRVHLEHASGEMYGEINRGSFSGRPFSDLSLDELLQLMSECRADEESVRVLSAYLDRAHPEWRETAQGARQEDMAPPGSGSMSKEEAFEILGLSPGASIDEIKSAHKALLNKIHPDHGGSTYLAAKINQAKDVLLET